MSGKVVAGIIVGCVAVGVVAYFVLRNKKNKDISTNQYSNEHKNTSNKEIIEDFDNDMKKMEEIKNDTIKNIKERSKEANELFYNVLNKADIEESDNDEAIDELNDKLDNI